MKPTLRVRQRASWLSDISEIIWLSTTMLPLVGWSRPAIRFSSVVLPEPDGPISVMNSAAPTSRFRACKTLISSAPRENDLYRLRTCTIGCAMNDVLGLAMSLVGRAESSRPTARLMTPPRFGEGPGEGFLADHSIITGSLPSAFGSALRL